jgi:hypothetical protein
MLVVPPSRLAPCDEPPYLNMKMLFELTVRL